MTHEPNDDPKQRMTSTQLARSNLRLALTLASVAVAFFVGIIAARFYGAEGGGLTVLGLAIVVFLAVAIGRSVRSRK